MGFDYGPASWTPDGKWLVAFDADAKVAAISMQTRERRKFTEHTVAWWEQDVAVPPDGKTVAFARCLTLSSCDVYVKPIEDGQPLRLTFDHGSMAGLAWTPDSREIIYALDGRLYRLPADGRTVPLAVELVSREPLLGRMSSPTVARFPSNGSTRMLFQHRTRDIDIWVTEISGDSATGMAGNRRKLIDSPERTAGRNFLLMAAASPSSQPAPGAMGRCGSRTATAPIPGSSHLRCFGWIAVWIRVRPPGRTTEVKSPFAPPPLPTRPITSIGFRRREGFPAWLHTVKMSLSRPGHVTGYGSISSPTSPGNRRFGKPLSAAGVPRCR